MTRTRQFSCGENLAWKTIPFKKPPWFVWQSVQRADPDQQWSYCRALQFLCLEKPPFPSLFYFQRGCFKARDTHFGEVTGHGGPRIDLLKLGWKVCMACWVNLGTHKHWIKTADVYSMSTRERQADRVMYLKNIGIPVASLLKRKRCWSQMNVFAYRPDSQRKEPTWHNIVQWYTPPIPSSQVCPSTTSCDDHCGWEWCWWTTKSWWFGHSTNSHELILADTIRWDQSCHTDGCLDFNLTGKTLCWFPPKRVGILMDTSNSAWIVASRVPKVGDKSFPFCPSFQKEVQFHTLLWLRYALKSSFSSHQTWNKPSFYIPNFDEGYSLYIFLLGVVHNRFFSSHIYRTGLKCGRAALVHCRYREWSGEGLGSQLWNHQEGKPSCHEMKQPRGPPKVEVGVMMLGFFYVFLFYLFVSTGSSLIEFWREPSRIWLRFQKKDIAFTKVM